MIETGYVKYSCDWIKGAAPNHAQLSRLIYWRDRLFDAGVIGVSDSGIGYGNVSLRGSGDVKFIISGTQTGNIKHLSTDNFALVKEYSLVKNWVKCEGPVMASSEALTHAALYEADLRVNCVLHVHSRAQWQAQFNLAPTTAKDIEAGTPEMALAVKAISTKHFPSSAGLIVMGGHQDGILAFGGSCDDAGKLLISCLNECP